MLAVMSVTLCALPAVAVNAARVPPLEEVLQDSTLTVPVHMTRVVQVAQPAKRISLGNPAIADINVFQRNQIYVVGKKAGATNVVVWNESDEVVASFNIEVTQDLDTLKRRLHELLPGENIRVHSAQGKIVVSGSASSAVKVNAALELARSFVAECPVSTPLAPGPEESGRDVSSAARSSAAKQDDDCKEKAIVNMLEIGGSQQVMLEVKVAEISRELIRELDTNLQIARLSGDDKFGVLNGGAAFPSSGVPALGGTPVGPTIGSIVPTTPTISSSGLFLGHLSGNTFIQAIINASRTNNLAKILAEPTLTALSGQQAEFLSGGEFPIPVPQGGTSNAVTIVFKKFGVNLKFLPMILDPERINLKLTVSVSELSNSAAVVLPVSGSSSSFVIPSLTERSAGTEVELADGQTIGIAGLINDITRESVRKFPGLGDIPIFGQLFSSQQFQSGQTELVIFVTPHLARPIRMEQVRLPTDSFVPPNDIEFYLLGRTESAKSGRRAEQRSVAPAASVSAATQFGHAL